MHMHIYIYNIFHIKIICLNLLHTSYHILLYINVMYVTK